jgi:hypothetical protein
VGTRVEGGGGGMWYEFSLPHSSLGVGGSGAGCVGVRGMERGGRRRGGWGMVCRCIDGALPVAGRATGRQVCYSEVSFPLFGGGGGGGGWLAPFLLLISSRSGL